MDVFIVIQGWNGTATTTVIEGGLGWTNIVVSMPNFVPSSSPAYRTGRVISGNQLPSYAANANELAFLQAYNFSTLYTPLLLPDVDGFNSGNYLICLTFALVALCD